MRPHSLIVRAYAIRGVYLWLGTRALASLVMTLGRADPLHLSAAAHLNFVLLSVAVCFLDIGVHRERALLGNLAVSWSGLAAIFAAPAIAGELALLIVGLIA
jgi:hypothetical protein